MVSELPVLFCLHCDSSARWLHWWKLRGRGSGCDVTQVVSSLGACPRARSSAAIGGSRWPLCVSVRWEKEGGRERECVKEVKTQQISGPTLRFSADMDHARIIFLLVAFCCFVSTSVAQGKIPASAYLCEGRTHTPSPYLTHLSWKCVSSSSHHPLTRVGLFKLLFANRIRKFFFFFVFLTLGPGQLPNSQDCREM